MDDVRERVRRRLDRLEPSPGGFESTLRRIARHERNRRLMATGLSLVLTAGLAAGLWFSFQRQQPRVGTPASPTPNVVSNGPRLFLAGDGEMWIVDVDTSSVRHVRLPELSPGDPPYRIVRRGNRLVLWGSNTYALDPMPGAEPITIVKDSLAFIPSAAPDRLWVAVDATDTANVGALREVSVNGRVTVPDIKPPRGQLPVAALENHLVFEHVDGALEVWNWATRKVVRRLPGEFPIASHGNLLAWCARRCNTVHVTDVATGRDSEIFPPPDSVGFRAHEGEFSPDGRTIAVPVCTDDRPRPTCELGLIDLRTGTTTSPKGTETHDYIFIEWAPSGGTVFISGGERLEKRFLIQYQLGSTAGLRLPIDVGDFYGMAAA